MSKRQQSRKWMRSGVLLLILLFAFALLKPYIIVPAGECAVVFNVANGSLHQVGEGFHWVLPFVHRWFFYDVRTQTYTMSGTSWEGEVRGDDSLRCLTSDGQTVDVDISLRFHLDRDNVWRLHQNVGRDYVSKIIRPEVRSQTRIAFAEYPISDVYSDRRQEVVDNITRRLRDSLQKNYLVVDEVLLRNVNFSEAFRQAVEEKQIAQQEAQRMQYVLRKAEKEKQKRIIEAEGEARAIELKGQALAESAKVIDYEYVRRIAPNVKMLITDGKSMPMPGVGAPAATTPTR